MTGENPHRDTSERLFGLVREITQHSTKLHDDINREEENRLERLAREEAEAGTTIAGKLVSSGLLQTIRDIMPSALGQLQTSSRLPGEPITLPPPARHETLDVLRAISVVSHGTDRPVVSWVEHIQVVATPDISPTQVVESYRQEFRDSIAPRLPRMPES